MSINASALTKSFGALPVLDSVSIDCQKGAVTALVGANGAGKTTLFKILLGLLKPDSGVVTYGDDRSRSVGGFVEKPAFYPYLSAASNIALFARLNGLDLGPEQIDEKLKTVGLSSKRKDPVRNYSMGMKQRLGIAISLLKQPETLILDEPFSGLDPIGIRGLSELLLDLARRQQMAVLISSHFVEQLIKFCDVFYVIKNGAILTASSASELLALYTTGYTLTASGLADSNVIKEIGLAADGESVYLDKKTFEKNKVLKRLVVEGIAIRSVIPVLDMDHLFESRS
jgi:ABC-2 type transport system ATP-binding protein